MNAVLKKISLISIACVTFLALSEASWASNRAICLELLDGSSIAPKDGLGYRGFLGTRPELTPESSADLHRIGVMRWGQRIYVRPTLADTRLHDQEEANPLLKGFYLLGGLSLPQVDDGQGPQYFRQLVGNGLYFFVDGEQKAIDGETIRRFFDPELFRVSYSDEKSGPYLYQEGWFFPKIRGIIDSQDTSNSSTYKKLNKWARGQKNQGFRVTFNQDFEQALRRVPLQERKGQISGSSRYSEELIKHILQDYEQGHAFSVEVWNPEGKLVGGLVGYRHANLFSPDSVFYDDIDYAKLALMALIDRLREGGIPFVDAGMVTPFTASMKGKLIPAEEFQQRIESLNHDLPVELSTEWLPR